MRMFVLLRLLAECLNGLLIALSYLTVLAWLKTQENKQSIRFLKGFLEECEAGHSHHFNVLSTTKAFIF